MSQRNFSSSRGPGTLTGILIMLMGFFVLGITFDLIPTNSSNIQAPGWVLAVFGGMFVIAGAWAVLQRLIHQDTVEANWMNYLLALLVMTAVSVTCLWVGFGPGSRLFVQTDTFTGRPTALLTDPFLGRIFFVGFGVLMSGVTIAIAVIQGRKLFSRKDDR